MEKKNLKLKTNFTQLISQVSNLYKEVFSSENESYNLGKKDAYEEILNWFINNHNGELKYISAGAFINMLQEKLTKVKSSLKSSSDENSQEDDIKAFNLTGMKISENRKRTRATDMDIEESNFNIGSPEYNSFISNSDAGNSNLGVNVFAPQAKKKKFK
jgi:hypothetical protein